MVHILSNIMSNCVFVVWFLPLSQRWQPPQRSAQQPKRPLQLLSSCSRPPLWTVPRRLLPLQDSNQWSQVHLSVSVTPVLPFWCNKGLVTVACNTVLFLLLLFIFCLFSVVLDFSEMFDPTKGKLLLGLRSYIIGCCTLNECIGNIYQILTFWLLAEVDVSLGTFLLMQATCLHSPADLVL